MERFEQPDFDLSMPEAQRENFHWHCFPLLILELCLCPGAASSLDTKGEAGMGQQRHAEHRQLHRGTICLVRTNEHVRDMSEGLAMPSGLCKARSRQRAASPTAASLTATCAPHSDVCPSQRRVPLTSDVSPCRRRVSLTSDVCPSQRRVPLQATSKPLHTPYLSARHIDT